MPKEERESLAEQSSFSLEELLVTQKSFKVEVSIEKLWDNLL